jgi:hypothetical protein
MTLIDRLKAAWSALTEVEEPVNEGHRYAIVIGDTGYYADSYTIDPYSGLPEWDYQGADGHIHGKRYEGWVLKEFRK